MNRRLSRAVLSYGCFDGFETHHVDHLRRAADLGHELIIGCATDRYIARQGLICGAEYNARKEMLEHCRFVDRVIPLDDIAQVRTDIVNHDISVLVTGQEIDACFAHLHDIAQIYPLLGLGIESHFFKLAS